MRQSATANPLPAAALPLRVRATSAVPLPTEGDDQRRLEADAIRVTRTRKICPPTMAVTTRPLIPPPQSLPIMALPCLHEQGFLGRLQSHFLHQTLPTRTVTMNSPLARRLASLRLCVVVLSSLSLAVLAFGVLLARHYPMGVRRGTPPLCPQHDSASGEASLLPSLLYLFPSFIAPPTLW